MNLDDKSPGLEHPVLVLVEGRADAAFVTRLCDQRQISNLACEFPHKNDAGGYGQNAFVGFLRGLPTRPGFKALRAVVVMYDNDSDPHATFQKVLGYAQHPEYVLPDEPGQLADVQQDRVRVLFLPIPAVGERGALETLLLQAINGGDSAPCVEAFEECVDAHQWSESHRSKMRLRSFIAANCPGEADTSLAYIWSKQGNPIDLSHDCFADVASAIHETVEAV